MLFAPPLSQILKHLKGSKRQAERVEYIKESDQKPKKLLELQDILTHIIAETFKKPTTKDTEEEKVKRMKEQNFNTLLMVVVGEAIRIASLMAQRRSVAIAGPFQLAKAHQLTQILNRAYS